MAARPARSTWTRRPGPDRLRHLLRARRGARRRTGTSGRRSCADPDAPAVRAAPTRRPRRVPRLAAAAAATSSSPPPTRRPATPACRSASCTTSRSASTRAAPTAGCCRTCSPPACTSGAPPDAFNQLGQDWGLAAVAARPAGRDRLRGVPGHAARASSGTPAACGSTTSPGCGGCGGCRRAWAAAEGTYVHYDPEAMLGILALEAHRAGAVVIGEDLGTVLPVVTEGLARTQHAGLGGALVHPRRTTRRSCPARRRLTRATRWPASPPTTCRPRPASWPASRSGSAPSWASSPAPSRRRRERRAGPGRSCSTLLRRRGSDRRRTAPTRRSSWRCTSSWPGRRAGWSPPRSTTCWASSRQPNLPGTTDQYPNWRMPLGTSLEEIVEDPRMRRIAEVLSSADGRWQPER